MVKIKKRLLFLLAAAALLLGGCGGKKQEEGGYTIYYANASGTRLVESKYSPTAETFEELMEELKQQLATAPTGYVSVLKNDVEMNSYERGIDALRIDFSPEYYGLSNTDEVLLRAAVVKTFAQIPGVTKVMITVNQEQLQDGEGQQVPAMDADSFIDTKEGGINSYQYAKLSLYFPDETGRLLVREHRNLHYSSNMVLERVVLEQLIAGPEKSGGSAFLDSSVKIQKIQTKDGICTVMFDSSVNDSAAEIGVEPRVALYAIVNSICATCDEITGVQFEIAGDDSGKFRGEVDLGQVFSMDYSYIREEELQSETSQMEENGTESVTAAPESAPSETPGAEGEFSGEENTEE